MIKVTEKCQYLVLQDEDGMVFLDKDEMERLRDLIDLYIGAKELREKHDASSEVSH